MEVYYLEEWIMSISPFLTQKHLEKNSLLYKIDPYFPKNIECVYFYLYVTYNIYIKSCNAVHW